MKPYPTIPTRSCLDFIWRVPGGAAMGDRLQRFEVLDYLPAFLFDECGQAVAAVSPRLPGPVFVPGVRVARNRNALVVAGSEPEAAFERFRFEADIHRVKCPRPNGELGHPHL